MPGAATSRVTEFAWERQDDAIAYEIVVTDRNGIGSSMIVFEKTRLMVEAEEGDLEIQGYKLTADGQSTIAVRDRPADPGAEAISLERFAAHNIESLPIIRFKAPADSELRVEAGGFRLEWIPSRARSARAVHVRVYNETEGVTVTDAIVTEDSHLDVDLTGHVGCILKTYGRVLFDTRWGKFINGPGLRVVESSTSPEERAARERFAVARESFYDDGPRDVEDNLERLLEDIGERRTRLRSRPTSISLMLGYDCNLDCLMCDEGRVRRPHRIPPSLIEDVRDNFLPTVTDLELIGGEPLLYPEVDDLARAAEDHPNVGIRLSTNGTLLNRSWRERIVRGNYQLRVSMDGATKRTYESVRRKASFETVTGNLRDLHALALEAGRPLDLAISFVIQKANWHEVTKMVHLARSLGAQGVHFNLVEYPSGDEWVKSLDAVTGIEAARRLLGELRAAGRLGRELGVGVDSRAVPMLINMYPSLVQSAEEARMLPLELTESAVADGRPDLVRREGLSEEDRERIRKLRLRSTESEPLDAIEPRTLPPGMEDRFGSRHAEALGFLKRRLSGALCDYPFTVLNLDTYRTYVCCQAQVKFLYGHRYDEAEPTVFDIWNSDFMQRARDAMYEEDFDKVCHTRCPYYRFGGTYSNLERAYAVAT